jgi:hypothetical protein
MQGRFPQQEADTATKFALDIYLPMSVDQQRLVQELINFKDKRLINLQTIKIEPICDGQLKKAYVEFQNYEHAANFYEALKNLKIDGQQVQVAMGKDMTAIEQHRIKYTPAEPTSLKYFDVMSEFKQFGTIVLVKIVPRPSGGSAAFVSFATKKILGNCLINYKNQDQILLATIFREDEIVLPKVGPPKGKQKSQKLIDFLASSNCEMHYEKFVSEEITEVDDLLFLKEADFDRLGLKLGPRNRLIGAI